MKMKKQGFLLGAVFLASSTIIVKLLGFLFTIPLTKMIGTEGMGYFYTSYELYNLLATIYSAGLPVALSKMISEADSRHDIQGVKKTNKVATIVLLTFGFTLGFVMFFGAGVFADWLKNPYASYSIKALSPLILFSSIMCVGRGYFQGLSNMIPTAVSSVVEAMSKLFLGVGLAWFILKTTNQPELASAGAITGVTVGSLLGAIYIYSYKKINHLPKKDASDHTKKLSNKTIFKRMIWLAIPITIGASVFSIVNFLDTAIVLRQLQDGAGFSNSEANQLYGIFGNTKKLFNLPIAFIIPLTTSVLPALASANVNHDIKRINENASLAIKLTSLIAFSTGIGFIALSKPIFTLIYPSSTQYETEVGSELLFIFGIAVVLCSFVMITNSILQALGKVQAPVFTMIIGGVFKVITSLYLVSNVNINIYGAAISTCICYFIIVIFNFIFLLKIIPSLISSLKQLFKPLLSACVMGTLARASYCLVITTFGTKLSCVFSILIGACAFLIMLIITNSITKSDLKSVPNGEKIASLLHIK